MLRAGGPWYRPVAVGLTGFIAFFACVNAWWLVQNVIALDGVPLGIDFAICREYATQWLAGEPYYPAAQLQGPYSPRGGLSLYPPTFLYLMVPFTLLPAVLWWAIPIAIIAHVVWRHRPEPWAWPLIALVLWIPRSQEILTYGNPTMWAAAAVAAGTIWRWPAALVLFKLTLIPFALMGINRRSWWIAVGVLIAISLPFGAMWLDYAAVVSGLQTPLWQYSIVDIPLVSIGVIAWMAADRSRPQLEQASKRP